MVSLKTQFYGNLTLAAKILFALCVVRGITILAGYGGNIPVIDNIVVGIMNFFFNVSGSMASRYHVNL